MSNGVILTNEVYERYRILWGEVDEIMVELRQDTNLTSKVIALEGKLMELDYFLKKMIECFWTNAPLSLGDGMLDQIVEPVDPDNESGGGKGCPGTSSVAP